MDAADARARLEGLLAQLAEAISRYQHALGEDYYERMGPDHVSSGIAAEIGALEDVALVPYFVTLLSESPGVSLTSGVLQSLSRLGERAIPGLLAGYARTSSSAVA